MHSTCVRNLGTVEFSDRDYKNRVKRKIHALIIFIDCKGRTQRESPPSKGSLHQGFPFTIKKLMLRF
jgi:hypothetical protein